MSFREQMEEAVVAAIAAADTGNLFATVKAIGGLNKSDYDKSGTLKVPFCILRYAGASGMLQPGSKTETSARLELVIGALSYKSLEARRAKAYVLLELVQGALMGKTLVTGMVPFEWTGEDPGGIEVGAVELWEQRYQTRFDLTNE